jgi:tellurite methyltransferase
MVLSKTVVLCLALCVFARGFAFGEGIPNPVVRRLVARFGTPSAHAEETTATSTDEGRRSRIQRLMAITGDSDFSDVRAAWDKTYNRKDYVYGKEPAEFLVKHVAQLPKGRALDIATGEGRNAVYLAKKGFQVEGVDISSVGLRKAQKLAAENGVKFKTINADLNKYRIQPNAYAVILNFYFLQRSLFPQIIAGLKKGGVLIFETNTVEQLKNPAGKDLERDFVLESGELKKAFSELEILHYSETNDGKNAVASLIARKR